MDVSWVDELREDARFNEQFETHWFAEGYRPVFQQVLARSLEDGIWSGPVKDEAEAILARCVPVATLATRHTTQHATPAELVLIADPADPHRAYVSLAHTLLPQCWARCEATAEAIAEHLAPYLVDAPTPVREFSRVYRVAQYYDCERELIERVLASEQWFDDIVWHSAHVEPPWDAFDRLGALQLSVALERAAEEHPSRRPYSARRTMWSQSVLKCEPHNLGLFAFELRYEPAHDAEAIGWINDFTNSRLPSDLPIDLAAFLLRSRSLDETTVRELIEDDAHIDDILSLQCALDPQSPRMAQFLRDFAYERRDDDAVLNRVLDFAQAYDLYTMWADVIAMCDGRPLADDLRGQMKPQEVA